MRTRTLGTRLALTAFLFILQGAGAASADVTITGTVGEIGILPINNSASAFIRFKMTDLTQTKTCQGGANNLPLANGYAWFYDFANQGSPAYREWYAALLVSKKGSPISCTINDNATCQITSCTLQ